MAPQLQSLADTAVNLKTIVYGGGPMYVQDLLHAMQTLGPKLAQIYGQGEAPMTITPMTKEMHVNRGHPSHLNRLASVGLPRTDVDVRVADAGGRPLPVGEVGEVLVRGAVVMNGYWRNENASRTMHIGARRLSLSSSLGQGANADYAWITSLASNGPSATSSSTSFAGITTARC